MKRLFAVGTCMAMVALGMVTFAHGQAPAQSPPSQQAAPEQQVTIVGCVQSEADYRAANNLGRGGAVGTGVGVGNEFVLVNASISTGTTAATPEPGAPTGTTGTGQAYELTGKNEGQAQQYAGRRVEIVGKLKPAETSGAAPTGGPTANTPPSPDLKLREVDVTSIRETSGTCPAMKK